MDEARLANLLDVLRDRGATAAEVPLLAPDGTIAGYLKVTLGPPAGAHREEGAPEPAADEDLPPGAYDPIAARKRTP
jgi:hypothetical protein